MVDSLVERLEQWRVVFVLSPGTPQRTLVLVALVMGVSLACAVASGEGEGGETLVAVDTHTDEAADEPPAPTPTPLEEVDVTALPEPEPVPEEPEPEPEPLPFDSEQLERIYAVQEIVAAASSTYGVDPSLINGLIWVESKFEPRARGPAGAQGLMQLMPKTASSLAKRLGRKRNSWDPDFNIHAGTLMLSRLLDRFDGDVRLALVGYNRGGGTVSKWVEAGEAFPEGAEKFVTRVLTAQALFQRLPPAPESGS